MAMTSKDHLKVASAHLADASQRLTDARLHLDNAIADGAIPTRTQAIAVNNISTLIDSITNLQRDTAQWKTI